MEGAGMVEVISSLERDGPPGLQGPALGASTFVPEAPTHDYAAACFPPVRPASRFHRPLRLTCTSRSHLIGLELGFSWSFRRITFRTDRPEGRVFRAMRWLSAKRDLVVGRHAGRRGRLYRLGQKLLPARTSLEKKGGCPSVWRMASR